MGVPGLGASDKVWEEVGKMSHICDALIWAKTFNNMAVYSRPASCKISTHGSLITSLERDGFATVLETAMTFYFT